MYMYIYLGELIFLERDKIVRKEKCVWNIGHSLTYFYLLEWEKKNIHFAVERLSKVSTTNIKEEEEEEKDK